MTFVNDKKTYLEKIDKSQKGSIDKKILNLINKINDNCNYYTTSSCAGRIVLLAQNYGERKNQVEWLLKTHNKTNLEEIKEGLSKLKDKDVWLKQESAIIHISCNTLDNAISLLNIFKNNGFKRSGITSIKNKIILEIMSTEHMDCIVAKKGNQICDDVYLGLAISEANNKLEITQSKLKKIEKKLN